MDENNSKQSKLTIILLFLITITGAYLAYTFAQSQEDNIEQKNSTIQTQEILQDDTNSSTYTLEEVATRNTAEQCWTVIDSSVYDITSYVPNHPGGEGDIIKICGKDGSNLFSKPQEHKDGGADNVLSAFKIGTLKQ
ncbi:MAG: hypothetical protein RLZZ223_147 [Candidatus Parcubacteria bacterium]|jgi:cytochrome b involved in lipid metabolism